MGVLSVFKGRVLLNNAANPGLVEHDSSCLPWLKADMAVSTKEERRNEHDVAGAYTVSVVLLLLTPGPVVALVTGTAVRHGYRQAWMTLLGTNGASLVLILMATLILAGVISLPPLGSICWAGRGHSTSVIRPWAA